MEHTGFPSEETLAAFIDGRLDDETRRRVVEHMAECAECRDTYLIGVDFGRAAPGAIAKLPQKNLRRRASYAAVFPIAAAAILLALFGLLPDVYRYIHPSRGSMSLVEAANRLPYRTLDSRLKGPYVYKERRVTRGGGDDQHDPDMLELRAAANDAERQSQSNPTLVNLLRYGTASILLGDYSEAQTALEDALHKKTGRGDLQAAINACVDIDLLNALSALYTARAESHPADRPLAVEVADRAWRLSRTPETAWNRAVALEGIHDQGDAEQAWIDYLWLDPDSPWSCEAMRRLRAHRNSVQIDWLPSKARLITAAANDNRGEVSAIVAHFRQESRSYAEGELLARWASHMNSGSPAVSADYRSLSVVGKVLSEINGDTFITDLANRIAESDERTKKSITAAVDVYTRARKMHFSQDASKAAATFEEASNAFQNTRFPLWMRADVLRATALYYAGQSAAASDVLGSLDRALAAADQGNRYPSIVAQLLWTRGDIAFSQGHPIEALRDYQHSTALFERLGESENTAFLHTLTGQVHAFVGQPQEAWRDYILAATTVEQEPTIRRAPLIMGHLARAALERDYIAASGAFQRTAMKTGGATDLSFRVDSFLAQARSAAARGELANARQAIVSANDSAQVIADLAVRKRIENDIQAAAAEAGILDRQQGNTVLTAAIADSERDRDVFRLSRFYFLRANLHEETNQREGATSDYEAGIAALREHRSDLRRTADISDWLRSTRGSFDRAIEFAMKTGRPELALAWAESARWDTPAASSARLTAITDQARAGLRPDDVAVGYWSTEKELYIWALSPQGLESHTVPIGREALRALSQRILHLLALGSDDDARVALGDAEELLFGPIHGATARANRIVIIADDTLAGVPYSALFDRSTRKYAVERFEIVLASSLNAVARLTSRKVSAEFGHVLVISDPAFDPDLLPSLKRLRQAVAEVQIVRRQFASAEIISDDRATIQRTTTSMTRAQLVHFAGHSIADGEQPALSALALAPDSEAHNSGLLYARDIEEVNLHNVGLLVLASCSSMSGASVGDGFAAIARSFATAGVRNVIGTLWDIRDDDSAEFMSVLYDEIGRGGDVAASIRRAQLTMIPRSPRLSWAAFELLTRT
jgi:CHAT domain-containing protein